MAPEEERSAYNPFTIPREQFRLRIRTFALCPLIFHSPEFFSPENSVKEQFDSVITGIFTDAGYSVVPSGQVRDVLSGLCSRKKALHDPAGISTDSGTHAFPKEAFYRELQADCHVDAVLYPEIVVVQADYTGGTARWCGAVQKASTSGRAALEILGRSGYGKVPAISIIISIHDMDGRRIYCNAGGIEILQKIGTYGMVAIPAERLLKSDLRNRRAVEAALAPLLRHCGESASVQL